MIKPHTTEANLEPTHTTIPLPRTSTGAAAFSGWGPKIRL